MAILRAGALWMLVVALTLGALFCLFFALRSLVEALTGPHHGRTRLSGVLIGGAFLGAGLLLGWGVRGVLGWLF